jgi:NAD(P)-dependent dehydrogenase (short-subunit alcohol dehydrogenase family)
MWAAIINVIVGLWITVSPERWGYNEVEANNFFIVGPMVVTAAAISIWDVNRVVRFFNLAAGVWLLLSPFVLPYETSHAIWNAIASGTALIIFSLFKGSIKKQVGGGWETLFKADEAHFKDKVVVITGATGGVGRVVAWQFARQGAKVVLIARDREQLEGTAREVEKHGGIPYRVLVDVADAEQVEAAAGRVEQELGPIDVWVNNAMNSVFSPFIHIKPEEFRRVTEVTYLGTVYGTMAALKRMKVRNQGSIVFVGSALAYRGIPLQSAYCGAKHGIQGFYDSLRSELLHEKSNIKTCMVQLPAMNTTQFGWVLSKVPNKPMPMGKVYQPEVAARAILFAAMHNRREILVGFPTYKAIVGNKIAPWYADWVLSRQGIKGQQTKEPADPYRKHNLWYSVGEDRGAYGDFHDVAASKSFTLWISMHRGLVRFAVVVVTTIILTMVFW